METNTTSADAIQVLRSLTPTQIEARLAEIDAERSALSTILRSVRARERVLLARNRSPRVQGGAS